MTTTQDLTAKLHHTFGFSEFKPGQRQTIETILNGHSALAIFPTGSGKSLCYQLSALLLPHLTLVVSPLLALMKDQLDFLQSRGISAAKIDSSLTSSQNQQIQQDVRNGNIKVLMISVERFKNERFRTFIESVALSLLVVDEAHCISEWGHNFRPDYLKLPYFSNQLNIPQTLLLTATATPQVRQDMALKFAIAPENIIQTGFYRANLHIDLRYVSPENKTAQLLACLQEYPGASIVYVTLQHEAEEIAELLISHGLNARAYHAGIKDQQRVAIQQEFMDDKIRIVVATIAFGMGIDKANVRNVIHYELPKSIESYSQEIGRAGRDGKASRCITLANLDGLSTLENFIYGDTPQVGEIQRVLDDIADNTHEQRWEVQLIPLSNQTNIRQLPLKTLLVQLELGGVIKPMFAYFAEFKFRFVQPKEQILSQFEGERKAFLSALFDYAPIKSVWATLDTQAFHRHYPFERSRLLNALEYLQQKQWIELQSQRSTEVFSVATEKLKASGLAASLFSYFTDKEHKEIARIEQLLEFFQSKSCLSDSLARYFSDPDAPRKCGHCSVCLGAPLSLPAPRAVTIPPVSDIREAVKNLSDGLYKKLQVSSGSELSCRFLAGLTSPYLTRIRARSIAGFGLCKELRYAKIRELVHSSTSWE